MSKEYIIEVMEGPLTQTYTTLREGNTFYYDHNSPIGVSTIDVRNKRVVSYKPKRRWVQLKYYGQSHPLI